MQEQGGDKDMNPVWLAHSRLRRRRFDDCIDVCSSVLDRNPYDQAVWYLKTRALTLKQWIDDSELEAEGIAGAPRQPPPFQLARPRLCRSHGSASTAGGHLSVSPPDLLQRMLLHRSLPAFQCAIVHQSNRWKICTVVPLPCRPSIG